MSSPAATLAFPRPAFILWRHVIRELVAPTALGFSLFTFLLLMRFLLEISQLWIQYGAELSMILWAIVYSLPHIVVLTLPMGLLLGGLIAFGRMSADFEVVALRALGVSLMHLVPPVLLFSVALWLLNTWLFMVAMPWGNQSLRELQWETITQRAFSQEVKPRVFHDNFPNMVLYVEDIVDQGREWRGVFAAQTERTPPAIVRAERAFPIIDEEERNTYLLLENATMVVPDEDPRNVTITRFAQQRLLVYSEARDSIIGTVGFDPRSMTLEQLREAIATRAAEGDPAYDLQVEVHKKYAFPFACVVLGLISLPLGISTQRQTTAIGFGIGTAVIVVYYFFAQNGEQQGDIGAIDPWLGMWAGNIVLGTAAALLLWKKSREADFGIARALRPHWERMVDAAAELVRRHVLHRRSAARPASGHRRGFPRLLDRYVLETYVAIYALAFVALVVVFVVGGWLDKASYVEHPELIPEYMRYYIWEIVFDVIPIAAVVTVLSTFSLMTKSNEVTAVLAGGVSLYRLVAPVLMPALLLSGVHYGLQDYVLPHTARLKDEVEQRMHPTGQPPTAQSEQTWVFSEGERVFHFADFVESPPEFRGLQVYYLGEGAVALARMEYADRAVWNASTSRWEGHDGWRRFFVGSGEADALAPTAPESFKFTVLPIEEQPSYFAGSPRQPQEMSTLELRRHVELLREQGYDDHRALVDLHLKLSFPALTFVMTLVGVPFAFRMGRQGALTGIAVAVGLVVVYWIAFGVFRALGYAGTLPPMLAAWAPHLLFFALAGYQALGLRT